MKNKERKSELVIFRVTPEEKAKIEYGRMVDRYEYKSLSDYIRQITRACALSTVGSYMENQPLKLA